jgi:O-antigen/teichoic acid export membrane protein
VRVVSLLFNTAWYLTGNSSTAAAQFLIVLFLGRFGDAAILGQYSLALAICSPVFLFSECKLREVMASDASGRFADREYFVLRIVTAAFVAGCFVCGAILLTEMTGLGETSAAVGVWKAFDSVADIGYGWFQRRRRMRAIGISMTLRNSLVVVSLIIGLTILEDLTSGILLAAAASGLILLAYDFRSIRLNLRTQTSARREPWKSWPGAARLATLSRSVIPLGAVSGLTSLRIAVPRYFIGTYLGERALGYFTAAYALPATGTVVVTSIGQALLPQIADAYRKKRDDFWHDIIRALIGVAVIASGGVLLAVLFGDDLLQLIYGPEYRKVHYELIGLSAAVGLTFGCSILGISLTAAGTFRAQVPIYMSVVAIVAVSCGLLLPLYGLLGAVYAMILSAAAWLVLSVGVLRRVTENQLLAF